MLILHVIVDLTPGGAELMLKRLIASHRESPEFRHVVISLRGLGTVGPQIQALGTEVQTLGMRSPLSFPAAIATLAARIRGIDPDVVQTWMYHGDLLGGLAARMAGKKHVVWNVRIAEIGPEMGVSRLTSLIRRSCARLSSRVPERIVYVAHSARKVHEALGYSADRGLVIPNGYALPHDLPRGRLRTELGLGRDAVLIGSAGRFNRQKDHRSFVAAAGEVSSGHREARFVLMGRGLVAENEELAGWISATGHRDRFHLLGQRDDILACFADLDILCLHSVGEGFPNVVAEAMSVGVPCVGTDVGDAAFLIGDTGTIVPPSDPPALAQALSKMIAAGPEERRRLGEGARLRIADNFSMEPIQRRYEDLYRSLAAGEAAEKQWGNWTDGLRGDSKGG